MQVVEIKDGKIFFKDRGNPNSAIHFELYYENGQFKTVEVETTVAETVINSINTNS